MNKLRFFFSLLFLSPSRSVYILTASFVAGILEGVSILALMPVLDIILGIQDANQPTSIFYNYFLVTFDFLNLDMNLMNVLSAFLMFIFLKSVFSMLAMNYTGIVTSQITFEMRSEFVKSLLESKWTTIQNMKTGASMNTLSFDIPKAASLFLYTCLVFSSFFQVLVLLFLMLDISLYAASGGLLLGLFMFLILGVFIQISNKQAVRQWSIMTSFMSNMGEILKGIKVIKGMNLSKFMTPVILKEADSIKDANIKQIMAKHGLVYLREPIIFLFVCVGLYLAVETLSIANQTVLIVAVVFVRVAQAMGKLQSDIQTFGANKPFYESYNKQINNLIISKEDFVNNETEIDNFTIGLKDVTFAYGSNKIFDNLNIVLPSNGLVTIEGESGIGKTTFGDLLLGLYSIDEGMIYINDKPIKQNRLTFLRNSAGYVEQDTFIFHDSITKNITMGDPEITTDQVRMALEESEAYSFVKHLAEGIDSNIGEGGSKLSGGQRQRIAIARALVRQPKMLILDEFTSALDKETAIDLIKLIKKISESILVIAITHDEKVKQESDLNLLLKDKKIVELTS